VLTRSEEEYLDCLKLEHVELNELLRQDEAIWTENKALIKRQRFEVQDQIKAILEE